MTFIKSVSAEATKHRKPFVKVRRTDGSAIRLIGQLLAFLRVAVIVGIAPAETGELATLNGGDWNALDTDGSHGEMQAKASAS